jgi:hypothetical protein
LNALSRKPVVKLNLPATSVAFNHPAIGWTSRPEERRLLTVYWLMKA